MKANQEVIIATETIDEGREALNQHLLKDIMDAGHGSKLTLASCFRTRWNMHETSQAFALLGNGAVDIAKRFYTQEYDEDGNHRDYNLRVSESWGLIYKKGDKTGMHHHFPSLWSYVYCVKASSECSPLVFPTVSHLENQSIKPEEGQIILFPGYLYHEVPEQTCDYERIMVAGNIMWDGWKD